MVSEVLQQQHHVVIFFSRDSKTESKKDYLIYLRGGRRSRRFCQNFGKAPGSHYA